MDGSLVCAFLKGQQNMMRRLATTLSVAGVLTGYYIRKLAV